MKLKVSYTVQCTQFVDWPDDEIDTLDYDNLLSNLDVNDTIACDPDDITMIQAQDADGEFHDYEFE